MPELLEDTQSLESTTVGIYRTATVVKGGRRFSFAALVVVGDRRGQVGIGYGKAPGVPGAIEKAQKDARKKLVRIAMKDGTLPHPITGNFGASQVRLVPAAPGTGVIAGGTARAVLEMAGVHDCLTKSYGSTNQKNLCKAVLQGLVSLRTKQDIASLRGVELGPTEVERKIAMGQRYAPQRSELEAVKPITSKTKGGPGGKRKPRGKRPRSDQPVSSPAAASPPNDAKPAGSGDQAKA